MKYICEICGRETTTSYRINNKQVCPKHYTQFNRHGQFLDNNPRTTHDLNDYTIKDSQVIFNLYNHNCEKISEFIIDLEDLNIIKYKKWRLNAYGYVCSGNKHTNNYILLHRLLLNASEEDNVDHINNNPLDNRKSNLRLCSKMENNFNKKDSGRNTTGILGIYWSNDRHKWCPEIRANNKRVHLGRYTDINEAAVVRMYAEKLVFKEFQNITHDISYYSKNIKENRLKELYNIVENKVKIFNV